jgi:hypothetical protein
MPDESQLGFNGNPNMTSPSNSNGEFLLYNSPYGTFYIEDNGNLWFKISQPNTWIEIGGSNIFGNVLSSRNIFTGDGIQDTFNLSSEPLNENYAIPFVGNIIQDDYITNGNQIVFPTPPDNNEKIIIYVIGVTPPSSTGEKVVRFINGNGTASSYILNHGLGTRNVLVEIIENSGDFKTVLTDVKRISEDEIQVDFGIPPALGDNYNVIIV